METNEEKDIQKGIEKPLMLSTKDNPFNPFKDFNNWYNFDVMNGYNSCQMVDRFSLDTDDLAEIDQIMLTNDAIKEIIRNDMTKMYIAIPKPD